MKLQKVLINIYIFVLILFFISLAVLSILGNKERVGYLGNLTFVSSESSQNNYIYSFKINYYDKVFRNSDIYGVYLNTNSLPDYIKEIKMNDEFGTPFGTLVSKIKLEDKLDNVKYYLKIKANIFVLITFMFIISILFIIFYNSKYLNQIMIMLLFVLFLFILFNISVSLIHVLIILLSILVLLASKKIRYFFSNNELKSRYFKIIFIFLSFLLIPGIVYTSFSFLFDKNNYENRLKEKRPILSMNNLYKYPSMYETYFNDYIPFRNELIQLQNIIDFSIFDNLMSKRAILGKNKWIFYKEIDNLIEDYVGIYKFSDKELEQAKNNILHFRDELNKKNIDLVFMICPDKQFIYTNYMPGYVKRKTVINSTEQFINYIEKNTDIKIVYPKEELIKYKDKYTLYYKYDYHWNYLGAYIGYTEFMKNIGINVYKINSCDTILVSSLAFYKDLTGMVNLYKFLKKDVEKIYKISGYDNYEIVEGKNYYNEYVLVKPKLNTNIVNRKLFVIRDSFSQAMFDYISSSFSQTSYRHIYNFKNDEIIKEKPDMLLFETVDRLLKERLFKVIPNYKIEEINKDLETNSVGSNN